MQAGQLQRAHTRATQHALGASCRGLATPPGQSGVTPPSFLIPRTLT